MKISKLAILAAGALAFGLAAAQRTEVDLETGETAMQISLQKEIFGILISDTEEVHGEYKSKGIFYKNANLAKYQAIFADICANDKAQTCPPVYFTKRQEQGIASMYPNGVLAINESIIERIDDNGATFVLAHEYAHYKLSHSKQRMKVIAKSVVDNAYPIREPEQALAYGGMFEGVKNAHYDYEDQADAYGFAYVKSKGIVLDCNKMFAAIAGGEVVSNDKHDTVDKRCANYKG